MSAMLQKAFGYQGDNMNLPVRNLATALPFYETILGFRVLTCVESPQRSVRLGRDEVQIGLTENGGDPTQDGCAFHVRGLASLHAEFEAKGLSRELSDCKSELRDGIVWNAFFVVAPDGLCYWFGERDSATQTSEMSS